MQSSSLKLIAASLGLITLAHARGALFWCGTIVAFDDETEALRVIRNGSLLVTNDRIAAVNTDPSPPGLPQGTERIDVSEQIITPGFVDTHRHGWQTALRTIASNTSLAQYLARYTGDAASVVYDSEDAYLGQLLGLYESVNTGVATLADFSHVTWSADTAEAAIKASVESGARVIWAYSFQNFTGSNFTVSDQITQFREMGKSGILKGSPVELGIAYDGWGPVPGAETAEIVKLI